VTGPGGAPAAPPDAGRAAGRAAADAGQAALSDVGASALPTARTAAITQAWSAVEATLQSALQSAPQTTDAQSHAAEPERPTGQGLVRALRQRDILSLDQGHALLDLLAVTERGQQAEYQSTEADVLAARDAVARLATASGLRPVIPVPPSGDASVTAAGQAGAAPGSLPDAPPPVQTDPVGSETTASAHRSTAMIVGGLLAAVLVIGTIVFFVVARGDVSITASLPWTSSPRARGIAAYEAGHVDDAQVALGQAERSDSTDPVPHIYLGRIAREKGDLTTARDELTTAVRLAPSNAEAEREMGAYLLAARRPELARRFYARAVALDPGDHSAQGWLACSLARLGQRAVAARFLDRAGPGAWSACVADTLPGGDAGLRPARK
jgi:tetratricopeptide (TPR) repeat protein